MPHISMVLLSSLFGRVAGRLMSHFSISTAFVCLFPLINTGDADLSPPEDLVVRETPHDRAEDVIIDDNELESYLDNMSD